MEQELLPLTSAQNNVWFHQLINPSSPAYNIGQVIRINGPIDIKHFENAQNMAWEASDSLRARFAIHDGKPTQIIDPFYPAPFEFIDLRGDPSEARIRASIHEHQLRIFDLLKGPCCRFALFQISETRWIWSMAVHHLVVDAPGGAYFALMIAQAYRDSSTTFVDTAPSWRAAIDEDLSYRNGESYIKDKNYWADTLLNLEQTPSLTSTPANTLDLIVPTNAYLHLPRDDYSVFFQWSTANGQGAYAGFVTCIMIYLSKLTGKSDLCIGSPTSGRSRKTRSLVGMLANAIPLRLQLHNSETPLEILKKAAKQIRQGLRHNSFPIGELSQDRRQKGLSTPFSIVVNLLVFDQALDFGSADGLAETLSTGSVADIQLNIFDRCDNGPVELRLDFNPSRYTLNEAQGHLERIALLIKSLPINAEIPIAELAVIDKDEQIEILKKSTGEHNNHYQTFENIIDLFEKQVSVSPSSIALTYEANNGVQHLSYDALNNYSNAFCEKLLEKDIGPDDIIGIFLDRSPESIISMLAVLKAGAAYLPIDPSYPAARQSYMLVNSATKAIVTTRALWKPFEVAHQPQQAPIFFADDHDLLQCTSDFEDRQIIRRKYPIFGSNLAYLIYTSGSTGKPKGAGNTHEAIVNRLLWMQNTLELDQNDVVLQKTGIGFDVAVWEWFLPLMSGAQLVITKPDGHKDPQYLESMISRFGVTTLHFVPSMLSVFLSVANEKNCQTLRNIVTSGEALTADTQNNTFSMYPNVNLWNLYGPTEAAIDVSSWPCSIDQNRPTPPIGIPIWNTELLILDDCLNLLPNKSVGELYIAGVSLSRGYLGASGLTAQRFIACPYGQQGEAGMRMYRTGDLAWRDDDGAIMYIGRADDQIKIRGFRIELGEIESTILNAYPEISQVIVQNNGTMQDPVLVAYLVSQNKFSSIETSTIESKLLLSLPEYMVPKHFVPIAEIPFTPNGKIDRKALPSIELNTQNTTYLPPRTAEETWLCRMFADLCGINSAGIDDNFFQIGGHSLLAMRLIGRVKGELNVTLPLRTLFDNPTPKTLASQIVLLTGNQSSQLTPGLGNLKEDRLHLSYGQVGLWALDQVEGPSATYNMPSIVEIQGKLDILSLEKALGSIIERHLPLRTTIQSTPEGIPFGKLLPLSSDSLPVELITTKTSDHSIDELIKDRISTPFALEKDCLLRAHLLDLGQQRYILLLVVHHLASDGLSRGILFKELGFAYNAFKNQEVPVWPILKVSYADWAIWQQATFEPQFKQKIQSVQRRLKDAPEILDLPLDRSRYIDRPKIAKYINLALPTELVQSLEAIAREYRTSLFTVMLSAYGLMLHGITNQKKIVVGIPASGRNHQEVEDLIGIFINMLPVTIDFEPAESIESIVSKVRVGVEDALIDQDLPFEKLIEHLNVNRTLGTTPIFQTIFSYQSIENIALSLDGANCTIQEAELPIAKYDLSAFLNLQATGEIVMNFEFDSNLFDYENVDTWVTCYYNILESFQRPLGKPIAQISLLSSAQSLKVIQEFTSNVKDFLFNDLLEPFRLNAQQYPGKVALNVSNEAGSTNLTYEDLESRSNQLANYLVQSGLNANSVVGLLMDRSPELIIAMISILKVGGTYLPLDPEFPVGRIQYMLEDSKSQLLISKSQLLLQLSDLKVPATLRPILLDDDKQMKEIASLSKLGVDLSKSPIHGDMLAYILYTSGSTGLPKGVCVSRKALKMFLDSMQSTLELNSNHKMLALTTIGFDISGLEIFLPLFNGAELVLASDSLAKDTASIIKTINRTNVTHIQATPSLLSAIEAESHNHLIENDLIILSGGEALPKQLANALLKIGTVVNLYGPTEATIWASYQNVSTEMHYPPSNFAPIGSPITNYRIYILNPSLELVPLGVNGEIYIAGDGLARGYHQRPGLSAERFIANPFGMHGERMYRTGDIGRKTILGSIEFLGRADDQVKIRGHRIELGEIEATILKLTPEISEITVVAKIINNQNYLVAYIVTDLDCDMPASSILRSNLTHNLPSYMIPDFFIELESFPLTPNGKINRKVLPLPILTTEAYKPPSSEIEISVCRIFSSLTKRETVGLDDNFFSIGGHSLLAMRLISILRNELGVELSLKSIFKSPTPAGIISEISQTPSLDIPILKKGAGKYKDGTIALSFGQVRLWTLQQLNTVASTYNVPAAIRIKGSFDASSFEKALAHVINRHESLRTLITQDQDGNPIGRLIDTIHNPAKLAVRDIKNLFLRLNTEQQEIAIKEIIQSEVKKVFKLDEDFPIRSELILLSEDDSLLLVTMHHHVSDGRSSDVLIMELNEAYEAYVDGREPLNDRTQYQYADWAIWQRNFWHINLAEKLDRIKIRLKDAPEFLTLPLDHTRHKNQIKKANHHSFYLSPSKTKGLIKLAQDENTTVFSALLSIYGALLGRISNQSTVVIGSPVEGRNNDDLDRIIGFMVNTLVFPISTNDNITGRELIKNTKELVEDVLIDQDFPFDQLVEHLGVTRSLEHTPVFQAMLAFQNKLDENLDLKGLKCSRLEIIPEYAKFDINLNLALDDQGALVGYFEYDQSLFQQSTIEQWSQFFAQLINAVVQHSDVPIITLSCIEPQERLEILRLSSGRDEDFAAEDLIFPSVFSKQAQRTPDAIAIEHQVQGETRYLTYRDLEERSNQIARYLLATGVKIDEAVAVMMHRSPNLIMTILGILKAGAAYLPLDISYPLERLSFMMSDSKVNILLTENAIDLSIITDIHSYKGTIVRLDDDKTQREIRQYSSNKIELEEHQSPVLLNHLAYIMYTSGSTGEPKGVGFLHGSLMNLIQWQIKTLPTELKRVLQYSPIGFDASAQEIAYTFSRGATLILVDEDTRKDFRALLQFIEKHSVEQLFAPFVVLNNLAIARKAFSIRAWPKEIYTAGEQLQVNSDIQEAFLEHPDCRLHNFYGPTEAHVVSNFTMPKDAPSWELLPPIGYPIFNTQLYVLNEALDLVPTGMIGELYIGGYGLARGYLNRPGLTATKFVACPFSTDCTSVDSRMYRTGDLARKRIDGSIEFLGRTDQQVKIRGYRIELGEIEAVILDKFPQILQVVVLPYEMLDDVRLIAYLISPEHDSPERIENIRSVLLRSLPDYMVPTEYVSIENLPLTSHGKLDRRMLPKPTLTAASMNFLPPETDEEKAVCSAISQLIGIDHVGVNDNFFSIGGHSLLAMKLIAHLKLTTNKTLSLRNIFEFPTPRDLSKIICELDSDDEELLLTPGMGRIDDDDE
jgi:amino acid adenylation domain-containing protein